MRIPTCPICSGSQCREVAKHQRWSVPIYRCADCQHGFVTELRVADEEDEFNTNRVRADFYASLLSPLRIESLADVGTPRDFYFLNKYREKVPHCSCFAVDLYEKPHPDFVTLLKSVADIRVQLCTAFHVLEHVPDAGQFVADLAKNSESFIVEVPHCEVLDHVVISSGQPHIHFFSTQSFTQLFSDLDCNIQVRSGDDMPGGRTVLVASRLPIEIPNNNVENAEGMSFAEKMRPRNVLKRIINRFRGVSLSRKTDNSANRIAMHGSECTKVPEVKTLLPNENPRITLSHVAAFTAQGSNAGDILLPAVLRDSVVRQAGGVEWHSIQARAEVTKSSVDAINRSNGLIIGGGGLFLRDTNANELSGWQWPCSIESLSRIDVPFCLMAVGYNRFRGQEDFTPVFREHLQVLTEKSVFIGLRNRGSVNAVRSYLPERLCEKVRFHPCLTSVISRLYPQIVDQHADGQFISLNCAFDRQQLRYRDSKTEILAGIARAVQYVAQQFNLGVKYYSHYSADEEMINVLSEHGVQFDVVDLSSFNSREIIEAYCKPTLALGMRGHSQLIPFGCGTPILSLISHNKLQWFLDDIGEPDWGVDLHQPGIESNIVSGVSRIIERRDETVEQITRAQLRLWEICTANNDEFLRQVGSA